jgi:hypothetical protein
MFFDYKDLHRKLIDTEATVARRIVVNSVGKHVLGLSEVDFLPLIATLFI